MRVYDEFVVRDSIGVLRCQVPAFILDYITINCWIRNDGLIIRKCKLNLWLPRFYIFSIYLFVRSIVDPSLILWSASMCPSWDHADNVLLRISVLPIERGSLLESRRLLVGSLVYRRIAINGLVFWANIIYIKQTCKFINKTSPSFPHPASNEDANSRYLMFDSGELHLKQVLKEDEKYSFRCEITDQLIGQTLISSTSGHFVITGKCSWITTFD